LVPFHWPVLPLYLTSVATLAGRIDLSFFSMMFLNTNVLA